MSKTDILIRRVMRRMESSIEYRLWSCEPSTARFLHTLMTMTHAQKVLEIGTFIGYTTLAMIGSDSGRCVTTLDVMEKHKRWFRQLPAGVRKRILFRKETIDQYFSKHPNKIFDVIFIDADHRLKSTLLDVGYSLQHIRKGGCIVLHDYYGGKGTDYEGPGEAVRMVRWLNFFCLGKIVELSSFDTEYRPNGFMSGLGLIRIMGSGAVVNIFGTILKLRSFFIREEPIDSEKVLYDQMTDLRTIESND